jgi:polyisoprenoid-binding protein YceI
LQVRTQTTGAYAIDKAHSEVTFQVRHLLTKVRGRFSDFSGTVHLDDEEPANASVSLTIDAASIDTNNTDRDQHLRSDDFFAVATYPTITFESSRVVRTSTERLRLGPPVGLELPILALILALSNVADREVSSLR